jgi:hypothetical protein
VSRLEDIVARNQRSTRNVRERVVVSFVFGGIILLIISLMVFTDLGKPPAPTRPTSSASSPPDSSMPSAGSSKVTAPDRHDKRVNDVRLRKAPSHSAPPSNPTPAAGSGSAR